MSAQADGKAGSNPSSIHSHGRKAKRLVAEAREAVARSLGARTDPEQLVFTSSGTEANQLAIRSLLEPKLVRGLKPHWITTPVEHDSTLQMVKWLEARGGSVSYIPVDRDGVPRVSELALLWREETVGVSAVWANNETGVLTDVSALVAAVRARGGRIHLDAAQAWGKLPLDLPGLGADLVSFSAQKIGALAGLGVLYVGRGVSLESALPGKQEKGRRGGSENLLGIIAAGAAAGALLPSAYDQKYGPLRQRLEDAICERIPGTEINGAGAARIANTSNLSFNGVEGDGLVMALDLAGYSVSSGSACSSGVLEPSHVLLALGRTRAQAMAAVRVSLAGEVGWDELEGFVEALARSVERVRNADFTADFTANFKR